MEWGIREFFLGLGVVGVVALLAHGLWTRFRDKLPLRMDRSLGDDGEEIDLTRSELPNGGARVVSPGTPRPAAEPAAAGDDPLSGLAPPAEDPLFPAAPDASAPEPELEVAPATLAEAPAPTLAAEAPPVPEQAPLFAGEPIVPRAAAAGARKKREAPKAKAAPKGASAEPAAQAPEPPAPPEVLVVHVLAREALMAGPALVETVTHYGLRYGDMNIFHHYDETTRQPAFSMASAVEPGTFDLSTLDSFETPGVSFFLQLPGPSAPLEAFEAMVQVAKALAERFQGELRDEQRSVMTAQTLDYCRQRIREFQRRQMSRPSPR
jgi:cell division protein ZipA